MTRLFDSEHNPLNHLGALIVFFFWIVLVSGVWLLIFFRTSVSGAFESVEYLTREQWYLGGVMRSLHRYASDAAIVTIVLHIVRDFTGGRFRGNRWFTWVTGLPLVWLVFPLGITGYWLVWDELAQYVAITSAELMDWLPIFTDSMAGNFLSDDVLSDRFFTLMAFLHLIGLPIFLVFGIWLHVFRLSAPRINPPRRLMAAALFAMLVLSAIMPAVSHEKANLAATPQVLRLDWFYLHVYPLVQSWSPGAVWGLLVATSGLIVVAPWASRQAERQPALVSLDFCNGCRRCVDDCPFGAVEMVPRTDGSNYDREAQVDPELCVSCGICVGACPTSTPFRSGDAFVPGIDLPDRSVASIRADVVAAGPSDTVLVFACHSDRRRHSVAAAGWRVVTVECMGHLPPAFIDFVLSRSFASGVYLLGCGGGDCRYRFGGDWTIQRLARERDPMLRRRIDRSLIAAAWQEPWSEYPNDLSAIEAFAAAVDQ